VARRTPSVETVDDVMATSLPESAEADAMLVAAGELSAEVETAVVAFADDNFVVSEVTLFKLLSSEPVIFVDCAACSLSDVVCDVA